MRKARIFALALVVLGLAPLVAHAQQAAAQGPPNPAALAQRSANYAWDQDVLRASFSFKDLVGDPELRKRLDSGLEMNVIMRAYLYAEPPGEPLVVAIRTCSVTYDLWDNLYRMHISDPDHDLRQAGLLNSVVRNCFEAPDLRLTRRAVLAAGKPYLLAVVVDVDPISPAMLAQIQRWIARPIGNRDIGSGDALFGGMVQLFVPTIGTSFKTIMFRTQSVVP